jgi:trimeric autotransporter adhesin
MNQITVSRSTRRLTLKSLKQHSLQLLTVMAVSFFVSATSVLAQTKTATTSVLTQTAGGQIVTTAISGTAITLTASVKVGATALTTGQVDFCDASAKYCNDIHVLGTAQLTSAGTATLVLRPKIGTHSYNAVFLGTNTYSGSASTASSLSITGQPATSTAVSQNGVAGNYTLTATVSSSGSIAPGPTGKVSLVDTTSNSSVLATAQLPAATLGAELVNISNPSVGNEPTGIVTGDFNGDGNLDLAVAINSTTQSFVILLGGGNGTYTTAPASATTATGVPLLVQDFNQDGIPDLLLSGTSGESSFSVLLGNGDGTFHLASGSPVTEVYGNSPVVVADFNGDGIPDLALAGGYYLVVELGNGDGTFTQVPIGASSTYEATYSSMVVADFNGDGRPDLAVTAAFNPLRILLNNGDGTFTQGSTIEASATDSAIIIPADFTGDGKQDLAVINSNGVVIYPGNGDGSFGAALSTSYPVEDYANRLYLGDFNGDGITDLLVAAQTSGTTQEILLGAGDGMFTQMQTGLSSLPCCSETVLGDFNNDGLTDIASSSVYDGTVQILAPQDYAASVTFSNFNPPGPGTQQVVASYVGDSNYVGSIAEAVALTPAVETPQISPSAGTFNMQQTITLTDATSGATIYYYLFGAMNTNTVAYAGPIVLSTQGTTQVQYYATEDGYQGSDGQTAIYTINHLTPPVTVTPTPVSLTTAQALSVTVSVGAVGGSAVPTGSVTLTSGSYQAQLMLATGTVTFNITAGTLPIGNNTLTATYTPDSTSSAVYTTATQSSTVTVAAPIGSTVSSVSVTPGASDITNAQTLAVAVAVNGTGNAPTGSVTLSAASSGSTLWTGQQPLSNGDAQFTVPAGTLSTGSITLTASYSGDPFYAASIGTASIIVSQVTASTQTPAAVSAGTTAVSDVILSAGSAYSGTMNLTCALTSSPNSAQSLPACSVKPSSVALIAGGSGTATASVATTAGDTTALLHPATSPLPWLAGGEGALTAALFFTIPSRRRRLLMTVLLPTFLAIAMLGCGGGSNPTKGGGGGSGQITPATTAGNYTFTVTGIDSTNAQITATSKFVVTVQ